MFFLREFTFCFIQQYVLDSVRRSDVKLYLTQITFTCSKLTIETLVPNQDFILACSFSSIGRNKIAILPLPIYRILL